MRHLLRYAARSARAGLICAAALALVPLQASAQIGATSRGGQKVAADSGECNARAVLAAKAQSLKVVTNSGGMLTAGKPDFVAAIICVDVPDSGSFVHIFVAAKANDGGVPGALRVALQEEMNKSSCRPTPWGFCHSGLTQ